MDEIPAYRCEGCGRVVIEDTLSTLPDLRGYVTFLERLGGGIYDVCCWGPDGAGHDGPLFVRRMVRCMVVVSR
jgi:hypothetical protein